MLTLYHMRAHHGEEGNGSGGVVVDGNKVNDEGGATDQQWKEGGPHQHLLDPLLTCWCTEHRMHVGM